MIRYGTNPIAGSNDDDWSIGDHPSLEDCPEDCRRIAFKKAAGGAHINDCECSNTVHGSDSVAVNDRPEMDEAQWERFMAGLEALMSLAAEEGGANGPSAWDGYAMTAVSDAGLRAADSGAAETVELGERPGLHA